MPAPRVARRAGDPRSIPELSPRHGCSVPVRQTCLFELLGAEREVEFHLLA
jgi:hypothetical protein